MNNKPTTEQSARDRDAEAFQISKARRALEKTLHRGTGFHLVACSATKLNQPAKAKDLYQGQLFKRLRELMEINGWEWRILSARHGALHPEQIIGPYDEEMPSSVDQRKIWASGVDIDIFQTLLSQVPRKKPVYLWCGLNYRAHLEEHIKRRGRVPLAPLARLGIGEQKKKVGQLITISKFGIFDIDTTFYHLGGS